MDEDSSVEGAENAEVEALEEEEEFEDSDSDDDDDDNGDDDDDESTGAPVNDKLSKAFAVLNGLDSEQDILEVNMEPDFYDNTEFVNILLGNVRVKRVYLTFLADPDIQAESLMLPSQDSVRRFLTALSSLPNLRDIACYNGKKGQVTEAPVGILCYCLSLAAQRLEDLSCFDLCLTGTPEEAANFGSCLRACKSLEELDFRDSTFSVDQEEHEDSNPIVNAILDASGYLPKLGSLLMKARDGHSLGPLDQTAMNRLVANPGLKTLWLGSCMLDEVANALLDRAHDPSLPKLESLELTVSSCEAFTVNVANAMSGVLKVNGIRHSIKFCLDFKADGMDERGNLANFMAAVAPALKVNTSMQCFSIISLFESMRNHVGSSNKGLWEQFADLMQVNTRLRSLNVRDVLGDGGDDEEMVYFLVILNHLGRNEIMGSSWRGRAVADRRAWVEMLARHSNCVERLFYYLSANPAVCELTPATASKKRKHDML